MATIATYDFQNKRALVRVDFNVPLNKETLEVTDAIRSKFDMLTQQAFNFPNDVSQ